MKTLKLFTFLIALIFTSSSFAQDRNTPSTEKDDRKPAAAKSKVENPGNVESDKGMKLQNEQAKAYETTSSTTTTKPEETESTEKEVKNTPSTND